MRRRRATGMTLIELLIALSISSALLVAIAAAFAASTHAIAQNDSYFRCTQTARVALDQLMTEVRRADAAQIDSGGALQIIRSPAQATANEAYRQFSFDSADHCIRLQIFRVDRAVSPTYVVAENITDCTFSAGARSAAIAAAPIAIHITCSIASSVVTLSGSATAVRDSGPGGR